jgi:multidrug efflux pump subunit AcrB
VATELKAALRGFAGVYEITDTLGSRQNEITLEMLPAAETLDLRSQDLARQVRQAFYGEEAQRIQRGRDDIRVMVRYPQDQRRSIAHLQSMRIRTPAGDEVPLGEVAKINFGEGLASIGRCDRKRIADVTALLQRDIVSNPEEIMTKLETGLLAELPHRYPGLAWSRGGGMEDQQRVLRELTIGFVVALFAMYALMAIAFKSYIQPVVIAIAIPFGFVGAVGGHILLGETFSIISFLGLVALAGVVVNDSIVLVDAVNRHLREGFSVNRAVRVSCCSRFRAIMLTSLTTFLGLTPLMSETSFQARFIIPMAVALAFGVAFASLITLTLVPAVYMIVEDLLALVRLCLGTGNEDEPSKDDNPADEPTVEYAA